jgi:hypothetical protein
MPYDVRMDNEQNSQSLFSNIAAISKSRLSPEKPEIGDRPKRDTKKKGDISEVRSDRISAR